MLTIFHQVDDEPGFIRFFRTLSTEDPDLLRIFERGDYYTAHGNDANFVARTVIAFVMTVLSMSDLIYRRTSQPQSLDPWAKATMPSLLSR